MKKCLKYLLLMVTVIFITVSDYQTAFAETYTEGVDDQNLDFFYRNYTLNGKQVVYNDEKQMYFFQTENKTKVSNVYYHTIAWEFSRTLPGTKEYYTDASGNREYVMFNIGYLHEIEYNKKNGTTIATYMLQLDDVLNTIRAKDQGWYDEIMELKDNNITAYMMVDAVIQIIRVDADGDKHVSGYITGGQYKGDLYFHENYKELNKTFTNKKVQDCSPNELISIGFWVEQKGYGNSIPKSICTTVADIEEKTGFTFFPKVDSSVKQQKDLAQWGIK